MGLDSLMFQDVAVALIVLAALSFSVWKLMPARRRLQLLLALDGWSVRHSSLVRWRERRLKPRIVCAGSVGCGACAAHDVRSSHRPR